MTWPTFRWLLVLLALAAGSALAQGRLHYSLSEPPQRAMPRKLVLLPPDVEVLELSAGGVPERVPKWTEAATENLLRGIREIVSGRTDIELIAAPELRTGERDELDQFLATYMVVGSTAFQITQLADPAWEHKRKRFDYTLGSGLAFLRERTGADAAIVLVGYDVVSTTERKALAILGTIAAAAVGVGVIMPMGQALVVAGIIDLASGDILWMNQTASGQYDLKDYESAREMLREIFRGYPGPQTGPR